MKFESEEAFSQGTIGHKPDSKPSDYDKDALNAAWLKLGNDEMKENQNGVLCGFKVNEEETDQSPHMINDNGWTASELHCCMRAVDSTERVENDAKDILAPETHYCVKSKSFEDTAFFMEKGVTDCGLPELLVCYRENSYHDVKDICVDEGGVPLKNKFVFEDVVNDNNTCTFVLPKKNPRIETIEEKLDIDTSIPFVLKSEADKDSNNDFANQCDSKDLMMKGEAKGDARSNSADEVSEEIFSLGDLFSRIDSSAEECNLESTISDPSEVTQQSIQISIEKENEVCPIMVSSSEESDNEREMVNLVTSSLVPIVEKSENSGKEANMGSPAQVSDSEDSANGCVANDVSYNSKVETASITFDFDSSAPTESNKEECPRMSDSEPFQTPNLSSIDDMKSRLVSSQARDSYGETSFSATGPSSGVITYSGPITHSGSLSLRSDSSTTSTRSFAFPVLQTEWNSSPVRMAKADGRRSRKHGGWRQGLLCCRF
ncbi:uncharacterized protein LOC119981394 isoform X2 [Tripterygium wilfordii]|uniref:uncharacterized protein LOC119981394 isoform X2 n=1 Tax=Tripterygium wilfordii TaxID=458696 RepID=UPI0018F861FC|nr:uncharacterized protein LOC119981394 isoform X2 [Tripterygium wilfordii]XP_038680462.1 uncharacterized protein LOC119981394 isoform X2 [Tripterygium wilfordii]XP_038680471.1 uncharacterized protein LOC119981394 isoform X2 [Tripterygium wilfordii]XP_038680479.1 uncharacterized protein LOC119981394 isoform X2 [Tripterygium wilfordii]